MAPAPEDSNMGTNIKLPYVNSVVIACFIAIAWYNVIELTVIMQTFFKRHSGLYYYSLIAANAGVFFHGLGNLLKFFHLNDGMKNHDVANTIVAWTGWVMMITGQSMVLYSRLHLLVQARWARWILAVIIIDGVVLHTSTGVLTFLTNLDGARRWTVPYTIVERIQVSIFFAQEVALSGIYIWKTTVMLKSEGPFFNATKNARGSRGRKVLFSTILMSAIIISLDITLIALEFSGLNDIQTTYKTAVYSIKLKMEFAILNALMKLVKGSLRLNHSSPRVVTKSNKRQSHPPNTDWNADYGAGSGLHHGPSSTLGHSAGAYARMNDNAVQLKDMKSTDVMKTTTTEVRVDRVGVLDDIESVGGRPESRSASASSSEVYIIEKAA